MPTSHAILSPSSAKRWMTCPASARLEEKMPNKETSYTAEGTLAHSCAENFLRTFLDGDVCEVPEFDEVKAHCQMYGRNWDWMKELNLRADELGLDFNEMLETVYNNYVVVVYEDYLAAKAIDKDAQLLIEAELKLDFFIPEGFGSSDAVIIFRNQLRVYDLKYGKGVKVSADHNPQMMCYAIGALCGPGELYNIDDIHMVIIQPRLKSISKFTLTYSELIQWGVNELKPAAAKAFNGGDGEHVPGDHCRFCRAAAQCKALRERAKAQSCQQPELLSVHELSEALSELDTIKAYTAALEEYALKSALEGLKIPGYKIVEGRSIRKIADPKKAVLTLVELGWDEEQCYKPRELRPITELEKMVGKKNFSQILGELIIKPQGKPALAPESDPRPEMSSAENDFSSTL